MSENTHTPTHRVRIKLTAKTKTGTSITLPMKGSLIAGDLASALRVASKHIEDVKLKGIIPNKVEVTLIEI
jgi:hypothetical protein